MNNSQAGYKPGFLRRISRYYQSLSGEAPGNLMYGHYYVVRKYTNTKLPYRIPGPITHGWHQDCGIHGDLSKHGEKEKARRYFVWNRHNLERCMEYGYKNVTAIGAPFLYLPPIRYSDDKSISPKSLLLFPPHVSEMEPFIDPLRTFKLYLEAIEELLSLFEPVTACLYWVQYENKGVVKLFEDKGIPVVTVGDRDNNPYFLINFQRLVDKYAYVSSDRATSAIFYSLYMRKKVFILGKPDITDRNLVMWEDRRIYNHNEFSNLYPELLWENFDDKSHYWIGEKELGLEFKRTPGELRKIFGWTPQNFAKILCSGCYIIHLY